MCNSFRLLCESARTELLEDILPFWVKHGPDRERGGFVGAALRDGSPVPRAPKCVILNARILWTFSAACRLLGGAEYRELAGRACDYFADRFLDREHGGAYYMLDCDGKPEVTEKLTYGQAFAVYALSEYARATGDGQALEEAMRLFERMQESAADPVHGGYFELFDRTWSSRMRWGPAKGPEYGKSMNTHLHVLEAATNLLRARRCAPVQKWAAECLRLMLDRVTDRSTGHYGMFFRDDWTPVSRTASFGHDIEGSWLMTEAAGELGDAETALDTERVSAEMARRCLDEAMAADGSMLNEYDCVSGKYDRKRIWWVQAEAVTGYLNAWRITGEERFLGAAKGVFDYILGHFVDPVHGEWYENLDEDGRPTADRKIHGWKACYHNARMCFEVMRRYEESKRSR